MVQSIKNKFFAIAPLLICAAWICAAIPLFSEESPLDTFIAKPSLKLDFPLFDLPYQINAARTLEYGFFESYTRPTMDASLNLTANAYSAFHFGMRKAKDALGLDAHWKKAVYYGGIAVGDLALFMLPVPPSYLWMHESFHRAGFTDGGIRSRIVYDFPTGAATVSEDGVFSYWQDYPRTVAAGIESEILFVEKLQRNNFFYDQEMPHELVYWLAELQAWSYMYMPFITGDISLTIDGQEQKVSTDSLQWVWALFHPNQYLEEAVGLSDISADAARYLKNRVLWSLVNFASPMMFGVRSIPLGAGTGWRGNFALRNYYTSFGTDISAHIYLKSPRLALAFAYHNYINYEHYFFALEAELLDFPLHIAPALSLLVSPRVMIGIQPQDQNFKTAAPEFFGLVSCRVDFAATRHFLPYLEATLKTDGWVAGLESLERAFSLKIGVSARL
jgi:hypothetical protein